MDNSLLKDGLFSYLHQISETFSSDEYSWEIAVEHSMKIIGEYLEVHLIESVIQSLDKSHKHMLNWYNTHVASSTSTVKGESDIIEFLFKNDEETLTYYRNVDKNSPPQLRKILKHKGLKSAVLVQINQGHKKLGYITLGLQNLSKEFKQEELELISVYSRQLANYISNQQQSDTIRRLVEKNSEQDRRLKEFTFITSHHLRAFSSNLASLTEYLLINPNEQRFIQMISNSVKKLNGSIEDINGILTHENDLITEELSKVRIKTIISKILEWHKKAINANKVDIENRLPRRLSIISQPEMLENIFSHIFSNAIKYGTNNDSKRIRIDHSENDEYLILRIRDFGDGIDMKKYGNRLFKAGSRFSKNSNSNLGMGLFLSKYQIQKIGGRIHLKSEPGKGTSVQCYLPLKIKSKI